MNKSLPSREKAIEILRKAGCSENVVNHSIAVADLATKIAEAFSRKGINVDKKLVEIGALLHDVGRAKTHTVDHAIEGAKIAEQFGMPESVIRIIKRHVGGGISPEEAKRLGWSNDVYIPQTVEEKVVSYADKLIQGCKRVPIQSTIAEMAKEVPEDAVKRLWKLHQEITSVTSDF